MSGLESDTLISNVLYSAFKRLFKKNDSFKETTTFGINEVIGGDGVKSWRLLGRTTFSPLYKEGMTQKAVQQAPYTCRQGNVQRAGNCYTGTVTATSLRLGTPRTDVLQPALWV